MVKSHSILFNYRDMQDKSMYLLRRSSSSNLFSSIGRSNFVFRDSDSQGSLSNESVDDSIKRRGVS